MQAYSLDISAAEAAQVTTLHLDRQGLECLPRDFVRRFPNVRQLHLNHNQLRNLPKRLFQLSQLRVVQLDHNRLTQLPDSLPQGHQLRQLSVRANRLRGLPPLPARLETLDLAANRFQEVPTSALAQRQLLHLNLASNRIRKLPAAFASRWPALQYLDLSNCGLYELPQPPPRLYALLLVRNQIREAPAGLRQLLHLQRLDLRQNPCLLHLNQLPGGLRYLDVRRTPTRWTNPESLLRTLPDLTHSYGGLRAPQQQQLSDFLNESSERPAAIPLSDYWQLWRGKPAPQLSTRQLLTTLTPAQPDRIAAHAHARICQSAPLSKRWLRQGQWTIVGQTALPAASWQRRFKQYQLTYTEDLAMANRILLGYGLAVPPASEPGQQYVNERALLQFLDPRQGRHLTAAANNDQGTLQLSKDLNGSQEAARTLTLQTLRAFGTPTALLPSLLLQWNRLVNDGATDVLLPYLPPFFQRLLLFKRRPAHPPVLQRKLDKQLWAAWKTSTDRP